MSILSSKSDTSSKRFSAIITLFSLIILSFIATFKDDNWVTPEFMFDALALIAGGGLGLTVVEKIFGKKEKEEAPLKPIEEASPEEKEEIKTNENEKYT